MSEYIKRQDAYDAVLFAMCGTGYQSDATWAIDCVPAADVAPVVHGRWIRFKEPDSETGYIHMRCSVCSAYWSDPSHADHFRYCPNCGAKMDGTEQRNNE